MCPKCMQKYFENGPQNRQKMKKTHDEIADFAKTCKSMKIFVFPTKNNILAHGGIQKLTQKKT